jgi:ribosomal protein S18 acetylase RimI-like enzyme
VDRVQLAPMSTDRFATWTEHSRRGFVDQQVLSGAMPRAEADAYATEQQTMLLPGGLSTPGHHFWTVRDGGDEVGTLWLRVRDDGPEPEGYVFDVEVDSRYRGRGLGRATMLAAEDAARGLGARWMRLNVFGHNIPAISLYDDLGYDVVAAVLTTMLDGTETAPDAGPREVTLTERSDGPGVALWVADRGGHEVGAVRAREQRRSGGLHVEGQDFFVNRPDVAPAVVAGVEQLARDRGAVSLSLSVVEPRLRELCQQLGYAVTAQLMQKRL